MTSGVPDGNLDVLLRWSRTAADQGLAVPASAWLVEISRSPANWWATTTDRVELAWRPTVDHLFHQVRLGVVPAAAVEFLPDALRTPPGVPRAPVTAPVRAARPEPAPGPERPAETPTRETPTAELPADPEPPAPEPVPDRATLIFQALIEWRSAQIAAGVDGAEAIKDITLRNLVKYNQTGEDVIRVKLPGQAKGLASDIAAVFARFGENTRVQDVAARQAPVQKAPVQKTPAQEAPVPVTPAGQIPAAPPTPPVPAPKAPERAAPQPGATLNLTHADFCDYDYPETDVEPGRITLTPDADGVALSWDPWPAAHGEVVVYRVVSADGSGATPPSIYRPEAGELLAATTATSIADGRFLSSAVRLFEVWCHVGPDVASACARQPVRWAVGHEVSPVDSMTLTEDGGRIIGRWTVFPGTRAVQVFRIPLDGAGPATGNPRNQICVGQPNLTGFVDADAARGRRFLYRAVAEVDLAGTVRLSRPRQLEILVPVELTPIADLHVEMGEDRSTFGLQWTTPDSGQSVRIYRFPAEPTAGLDSEDRDESVIVAEGFTDENLIKDPIVALDPVRSQMIGVIWPPNWERAYITPVTVSGDRVRVGTTRVHTRPLAAVVEPRIIERYHTQLATFGWPAGAAAVQAFVGSMSLSPEQVCAQHPAAEITKQVHERDGALTFRPRLLHWSGCQVCLVPVAYSRGETIRGEITSLAYPGLERLRYWFEAVAPGSYRVRLFLQAENDIQDPPPLVLVRNEARLPLEPHDGQPVLFDSAAGSVPHCRIDGMLKAGRAVATEWTFDTSRLRGYLRVFATDTRRTRAVAIFDPPMRYLFIPDRAPEPRPAPEMPR